jgi:UDP-N-acetyl-2-amino-2-deoxyglucuronate dehydrogenase
VEKPLALSGTDARLLARAAAEHGLVLSVVSQHVYDPLVEAVSGWLADGLLGRILYARAVLEAGRDQGYYTDSYWRGRWPGEGGSALINQGYHCLDVMRRLCGGLDVAGAVARAGDLYEGMRTENTISALFSADGVPATMTVTVGSTTMWRTRLELVGTAGTAEFDIDHPATLHRVSGGAELEKRAALERERAAAEEPPGVDYYGVSHRRQMADFARAVTGGGPMACTPEDGIAMVDLLAGIYAAAGLDSPLVRTGR